MSVDCLMVVEKSTGRSNGATTNPRRIFLTKILDRFGNALTLTYDAQLRLTKLTDATGRNTTFAYELTARPLLVTKITDPFGRSAKLQYDAAGRLSKITDVLGFTSEFAYDAASLINAMTTPYGTTTFAYGGDGNFRWLNATDPLGRTERVEFRHQAPGVPSSEPANTVPVGILSPVNFVIDARNSFYWDKHAYALAGSDYTKARITHWTHVAMSSNLTADTVESIKLPFENRVWFNYPGQGGPLGSAISGTLDKPTGRGRVLDDGRTQLDEMEYNALGHLTRAVDSQGRERLFEYDTNEIDLLRVRQKTSVSGYSTIAEFTYNAHHLPLTYTDAAGQTSSYMYNSAGQLLQTTNPLGQVTRIEYDALGYLVTIVNANNQTLVAFTYDGLGRIATRVDSEGHRVRLTYDALDRITTETYPDGTTRIYVWNKLDLASVTDRQGRVTKYAYNAVRELRQITDPLDRKTQFVRYENGLLKALIDPKGNRTTWNIDLQSRVTAKRYADGTRAVNAFEATTSRLKSATDALGQRIQYSYTLDDRLAGITYVDTVNPAPNVSFSYGPYFPRLVSMTDGSGTTRYSYKPVGGLGALRLAEEDGPYNNDTIRYQYDALGRLTGRTVDSSTETFAYDKLDRITMHTSPLGTFNLGYLGQTGQLTSQKLQGGNLGTNWIYEANINDRRLKSIVNSHASRGYQYTTTPEGTISNIVETATPAGTAWPVQTWGYSYDEANRLTHGRSSAGPQYAYAYDPADNITSMQGVGRDEEWRLQRR